VDDPLIYVLALHFTATVTVAGVVFFIVFITEPALRKAEAGAQLPGIIRRRLAWLAWTGLLLTVLSGAAWLTLVAGSISDRSLTDVFSENILWIVLSDTGFGRDWLGRFVLACLLTGLFIAFLRRSRLGRSGSSSSSRFWLRASSAHWPGPATPSAPLGSQASSIRPPTFCISSPRRRGSAYCCRLRWCSERPQAMPGSLVSARTLTVRFSTLGVVSVGTLLVTGTINTWYLVGSILALTRRTTAASCC
jgi:putative copper resistance protein D